MTDSTTVKLQIILCFCLEAWLKHKIVRQEGFLCIKYCTSVNLEPFHRYISFGVSDLLAIHYPNFHGFLFKTYTERKD